MTATVVMTSAALFKKKCHGNGLTTMRILSSRYGTPNREYSDVNDRLMLEMIPCEASKGPSVDLPFAAQPLDNTGSSFSVDTASHWVSYGWEVAGALGHSVLPLAPPFEDSLATGPLWYCPCGSFSQTHCTTLREDRAYTSSMCPRKTIG